MTLAFLFYYIFVGSFVVFNVKVNYTDETGKDMTEDLSTLSLFLTYLIILVVHPIFLAYAIHKIIRGN